MSAMAVLTILLTGFHGLDADHAAAAAWLICAAVGGAIMLGMIYLPRRPSVPSVIVPTVWPASTIGAVMPTQSIQNQMETTQAVQKQMEHPPA